MVVKISQILLFNQCLEIGSFGEALFITILKQLHSCFDPARDKHF